MIRLFLFWLSVVFVLLVGVALQNSSQTPKKIIQTDKAPKPLGAYSQGVMVGNTLYLAGQIGKNPQTGEIQNSSIETETRQVMNNLKAVLEAADLSMGKVVKTTIYLKNIQHFKQVNEVYSSYFEKDFPARETVQIADLAGGAQIEISMIAVK